MGPNPDYDTFTSGVHDPVVTTDDCVNAGRCRHNTDRTMAILRSLILAATLLPVVKSNQSLWLPNTFGSSMVLQVSC